MSLVKNIGIGVAGVVVLGLGYLTVKSINCRKKSRTC